MAKVVKGTVVSKRDSLQKQGVPIPDKLNGPQTRGSSGKRFKQSGGPPAPSPRSQATIAQRNRASVGNAGGGSSSNGSLPSLGLPGGNSASEGSVGILEAEFLACIFILVLILFASGGDYTPRMMSFIKRGALTCLLFFILALIAGTGPRASKVAGAFGALIIVGLLVTAPVAKVVEDADMLIKHDWVGKDDNFQPSSANQGTQNTTGNSVADKFLNALHDVTNAGDPIAQTLNGIIPGSGTLLKKIFHIG